MRTDQIITKVTLVKKGTKVMIELQRSDWVQIATTLKIADGLEFIDGDQFKVDYQNLMPK